MPKIDMNAASIAAARRRIKDRDFEQVNDIQVENLVAKFLSDPNTAKVPKLAPGRLLSSTEQRRFTKDMKFLVDNLNGQVSLLEEEIGYLRDKNISSLVSVSNQALITEAELLEEQDKILGGYSQVHLNTFVRGIDGQLAWNDTKYSIDFRDQTQYGEGDACELTRNMGLTLPTSSVVKVPIREVSLVGEDTSAGDSSLVLFQNSPRNTFLEGKVFRYQVVQKGFDSSGYKLPAKVARISLLIELAGTAQINRIKIVPAAVANFSVSGISYLDGEGNTQYLDMDQFVIGSEIVLLITPIETTAITINLVQSSPVERGQYLVVNSENQLINNLMAGSGFTSTVENPQESIKGSVYEFAIENISLGLFTFKSQGVFRGKDIEFKNLRTLKVRGITLDPPINTLDLEYSNTFNIPETGVLPEFYLGIDLRTKQGKVLCNELVPVPDSKNVQSEYILTNSPISKQKLFPDIRYVIGTLTKVENGTLDENGNLVLELTTPLYLNPGTKVGMAGPSSHPWNGTWTVLTSTGNTLVLSGVFADGSIVEEDRPKFKVWSMEGITDPFTIYRNGQALSLSTDYTFSLDSGATWLSEWPFDGRYNHHYSNPRAGTFLVRMNKFSIEDTTWVVYKTLQNQTLSSNDSILLRNNRVVVSSTEPNHGSINTVLVMRGTFQNFYSSPLISMYGLRMKFNVS